MSMPAQDPMSQCLGALANLYRRVVLYYLREHERASLDNLASCVAGWAASGVGARQTTDPETVRMSLHHVHLPKLADAGLITYDADAQRATLEPLSPTADRVLSVALDADVGEESVDHLLAGAHD
jgi:hypothetical protein